MATYHHSENPAVYRANASFVFSDANTRPVLELLDPQPGDVVLDVGCGTGELTRKIHRLVSSDGRGRAVGVDVSADMIDSAKRDARDKLEGLCFDVCDAHDLSEWLKQKGLTGTFDKVFSSAALHWMKNDPARVAGGMHAALKPNGLGTLALEMGGHMNTLAVRSCLRAALQRRGINPVDLDPWYFPTSSAYSSVLTAAGFDVNSATLVPRPTPLPRSSGLRGWLQTFAGPFLNAVDETARESILTELERQLAIDMYDAGQDEWTVMYVRLRVRATTLQR